MKAAAQNFVAGGRSLGPRQQVCGGDHREEPQRHRGAGDRRPRGSDHHARVLPGRGEEHDLREGGANFGKPFEGSGSF